jgi:hypothetical protein
MGPEGSLPCLEELTTDLYPEPAEYGPHPRPICLSSILIFPPHLRLCLPRGLFPSGLPTKTLYALIFYSMCATRPAHLILFDLIDLIIFSKDYKKLAIEKIPRFDSRQVRDISVRRRLRGGSGVHVQGCRATGAWVWSFISTTCLEVLHHVLISWHNFTFTRITKAVSP